MDLQQTWTRWKRYEKKSGLNEPQEIESLPQKSQLVTEFEKMSPKQKADFRDSEEWPEVASYYDEYFDTVQRNVGKKLWMMKTGQIPCGKIEYLGNTSIVPPKPVPESERRTRDPGGVVYHKPDCKFRLANWSDYTLCRCYSVIPRRIFKNSMVKSEDLAQESRCSSNKPEPINSATKR